MDLTISIVNYNTREMLDTCLAKIYGAPQAITFEVIVVDNGSSDGSTQMVESKYPQVRLIWNPRNMYFSAAHNQAFHQSRGRYFLVMNSDILILEDTLPRMVQFMDAHPDAGAASCLLLDQYGKIWPTCWTFPTVKSVLATHWLGVKFFPNSQIRKEHEMRDWDRLSVREVDIVEDAFMLARREAFDHVKGYDENLLLYYTERDICLRLKNAGWKIYHNSDARVVHYREYTSNRQNLWKIWWIRRRDTMVYFQKHRGWPQAAFLYGFLLLDALLRVPIKYIQREIGALST
jgi:hypothetical protein